MGGPAVEDREPVEGRFDRLDAISQRRATARRPARPTGQKILIDQASPGLDGSDRSPGATSMEVELRPTDPGKAEPLDRPFPQRLGELPNILGGKHRLRTGPQEEAIIGTRFDGPDRQPLGRRLEPVEAVTQPMRQSLEQKPVDDQQTAAHARIPIIPHKAPRSRPPIYRRPGTG